MLLGRTKPFDPPQYGRRMNVDNDPDFHEFLFGWDWCEPERELALDPWQFAADEPTPCSAGRLSGRRRSFSCPAPTHPIVGER
jgi:hypothetical protein